MDKSQISKMINVIDHIVQIAGRPGGALERGEFTMGIARKQVAVKLGLGENGLDEQPWKGLVKQHVSNALENAGGDSEPEPSPPKKTKTKRPAQEEEAGPSRQSPIKSTVKSSNKPKSAEKRQKREESPIVVEDSPEPEAGDKSESEMSSLYDVAPGKKRKESSKKPRGDESDRSESPKKKEKRPKKDPTEGLSPEEAKVAELQKIVVACGVRKQWSKEFADLDSPSQQKKRLEKMLADLGLKGAPTLSKAKALKEKRELAAELEDDVREFEAARGVNAERASRSKASKRKDEDEDEYEDEEEVESLGVPKEKSALGAIMDFLGDDGDDSDD